MTIVDYLRYDSLEKSKKKKRMEIINGRGMLLFSQGEVEHAYGGDTLKEAEHKGSKSGTEELQAAFQAGRIRLVLRSV